MLYLIVGQVGSIVLASQNFFFTIYLFIFPLFTALDSVRSTRHEVNLFYR